MSRELKVAQAMSGELLFDELSVGDQWISEPREITADDVNHFANLSGDLNPLHIDPSYAQRTPFQRPIAHGLLGLSVVGGLGSTSPELADVVLVGIREWTFLRPIYFGDQVHVVNRVMQLQPHGRRRGRVVWQRQLVNQRGEVVQQGNLETLVSRQPSAAHTPTGAVAKMSAAVRGS